MTYNVQITTTIPASTGHGACSLFSDVRKIDTYTGPRHLAASVLGELGTRMTRVETDKLGAITGSSYNGEHVVRVWQ